MLSVIVYKVTVLEVLIYESLQDLALAGVFEQGFRRIKDKWRRVPLQELRPFLESGRSVLGRQIYGSTTLPNSLKWSFMTPVFSIRVYDRFRLWHFA